MSSDVHEKIVTRLGHAGTEDYEIRGKQLYRDFRGRSSFWQLVAFGACGLELSDADSELLDTLATCAYVPDPRVWPFKFARLMAAYGNTLTGFGMGIQVVDSDILGVRIATRAGQMLYELEQTLSASNDAESSTVMSEFFKKIVRIPGFGVPARNRDERVTAFRLSLRERPLAARKFLQTAAQASDFVKRTRDLESNIAFWVAAACMDIGCSVENIQPIATLLGVMPMLATAHEGAQQDSPLMRALPADASRYVGRPPRESPRKLAARGG
jgi:hypothetical protein